MLQIILANLRYESHLSVFPLVFFIKTSRSEAFENPAIQKHYRNLEALALDMMAPEDTDDLISKMQTDAGG